MKKLDKSAHIGDSGIALIHQLVSRMGFAWHERKLDAGIDGEIELRNPATGEVANRVLFVQSNARDRLFSGENERSFHFLCDASDIDYWMSADVPVLLVCSHLFDGIRAPSTLGSFLRAFTWGNVRQLDKVARQMLVSLAAHTPLLPGKEVLAFLDIDSMQRRTYGYAKQGSGFGHTKIQGKSVLVRGLNVLAVTLSTPLAAPVVAATRLRGGSAGSARGAASLVRESIPAARAAGCSGTLILRGDSAFYSAGVIGACRAQDARFSVTAKLDPKVEAAIAAIDEDAWTPIRYPRAIFDEQAGGWVSDAEVAEVGYTAFTSKKGQTVPARLIVRRVRKLNEQAERGQDELFPAWRYYPIFTDSPYALLQAEEQHRDHAVQEQVNADLIDGPLAHLPSGMFTANAAWLTLAAITHNLLRALGCLASTFHAKARGATLRRHLISVPARLARHGPADGRGHLVLHLPARWRWQHAWINASTATHDPPATRTA